MREWHYLKEELRKSSRLADTLLTTTFLLELMEKVDSRIEREENWDHDFDTGQF